MIYPRLKLARDYLTDDGVIFISIDDNEVENLRKALDEIFGTVNFIAQISVIEKLKVDNMPAYMLTSIYNSIDTLKADGLYGNYRR